MEYSGDQYMGLPNGDVASMKVGGSLIILKYNTQYRYYTGEQASGQSFPVSQSIGEFSLDGSTFVLNYEDYLIKGYNYGSQYIVTPTLE